MAHAVLLALTFLGLTDANGRWYLFWSGVGGNVFLVGAAVTYHRFTCNVPGCHRIGLRQQELTGHSFCRRHDEIGRREVAVKATKAEEIPTD